MPTSAFSHLSKARTFSSADQERKGHTPRRPQQTNSLIGRRNTLTDKGVSKRYEVIKGKTLQSEASIANVFVTNTVIARRSTLTQMTHSKRYEVVLWETLQSETSTANDPTTFMGGRTDMTMQNRLTFKLLVTKNGKT